MFSFLFSCSFLGEEEVKRPRPLDWNFVGTEEAHCSCTLRLLGGGLLFERGLGRIWEGGGEHGGRRSPFMI